MNNKTTVRVMRAFAGRWLSKAETDTKRNLRKLVEFGCYFSGSVQINNFFYAVHDILKSSKSKYYILAHNLIKSVDRDRITEFGIAFGYNGFVRGIKEINTHFAESENSFALAGIIRNNSDNPIIDSEDLGKRLSVLSQNGVTIFFVLCDETGLTADELKSVLDSFPQKAFFLFTDNEDIALLNDQNNVLPVINLLSENVSKVSDMLKNQKRLFGGYCRYDDENADSFLNSAFLDSTEKSGNFFLFLLEKNGVSQRYHEKVSSFSFNQKRRPTHPIFITELFGDIEWLNSASGKS